MKRVESDLVSIMQERKSRFKRFFSAKRHRSELQDIVKQLERADANYMVRYVAACYTRSTDTFCSQRMVATMNAISLTEMRGQLKAIGHAMGISPTYNVGTRRATSVTFPTGAVRIEEV